jgi:hypothetical protein
MISTSWSTPESPGKMGWPSISSANTHPADLQVNNYTYFIPIFRIRIRRILNVPSKDVIKNLKKKYFLLSLRSLTKRAGSGAGSVKATGPRIRICTKMSRIQNTDLISVSIRIRHFLSLADPDPSIYKQKHSRFKKFKIQKNARF